MYGKSRATSRSKEKMRKQKKWRGDAETRSGVCVSMSVLLKFNSTTATNSVSWHVRLCFRPRQRHPVLLLLILPPTSPTPSPVFPSQLPIWSEWIPAAPSSPLAACPRSSLYPYLLLRTTPPVVTR